MSANRKALFEDSFGALSYFRSTSWNALLKSPQSYSEVFIACIGSNDVINICIQQNKTAWRSSFVLATDL